MIRHVFVSVVLAGIPAVGAAQPSTTPAPNEPIGTGHTVIADGHVDLGPRFVDGAWRLQLRDDTSRPVVWRNLPDIVLHAVDTATVTLPPDPAFGFLGQAGTKVWVLPQTQQPGILWPGWNTQDPSVIGKLSREATWRLHAVAGPGHFALFLTGDFGAPRILFDSTKPYPQETGIEVGSHVHGNWAFSVPGVYVLDIEMLASTVDGGAVSDRKPLRIFVGSGDPNAAFPTATAVTTSPAPAAGSPAATEPGRTPWIAPGAAGLALVVAGSITLMWLRRKRSRRGEAS